MIYLQLFYSFLQVGLFSIGGGYAALPLIQAQAMTRFHWLTMTEFADLVTIAEMTPGPIAINAATFVGVRTAGLAGALAATFGCITPSLLIVSLLAFLYYRYKKARVMQSVLASLRPAVVALIAAAGLGILQLVAFDGAAPALANLQWGSCIIFLAAFAALRVFRQKPILVMLCCGAIQWALAALPAG